MCSFRLQHIYFLQIDVFRVDYILLRSGASSYLKLKQTCNISSDVFLTKLKKAHPHDSLREDWGTHFWPMWQHLNNQVQINHIHFPIILAIRRMRSVWRNWSKRNRFQPLNDFLNTWNLLAAMISGCLSFRSREEIWISSSTTILIYSFLSFS